MPRTAVALSISLAVMLALPSAAQAQGILGNALNGLARKVQGAHQTNGFSDPVVQEYLVEFSFREGVLTLAQTTPVRNPSNLPLTLQSCASNLLNGPQGLSVTNDFERDLSKPRQIELLIDGNSRYPKNEYIAKGDRDDNTWKLYANGCGSIPVSPGTIVDASNEGQFSAAGINVASFVTDAGLYIEKRQKRAVAEAAQKKGEDAAQVQRDKLWLHASVTYLPNGQMAAAGQDEFSPFDSASECDKAVGQMRRAAISKAGGNAYPLGEAIIAMADGSGWLWIGCVSVKDVNSGTFATYMNLKMTVERAKTMKAVLDFPTTSANPPSKRGNQTKF